RGRYNLKTTLAREYSSYDGRLGLRTKRLLVLMDCRRSEEVESTRRRRKVGLRQEYSLLLRTLRGSTMWRMRNGMLQLVKESRESRTLSLEGMQMRFSSFRNTKYDLAMRSYRCSSC